MKYKRISQTNFKLIFNESEYYFNDSTSTVNKENTDNRIKVNSFDNIPTLKIIPTNNCSLDCKYCYTNNNRCLDKLQFDKIVNLINQYLNLKDDKIVISFVGGGEPTLNFELIKHVVEYTEYKKGSKTIIYRLISNGLFSREVCDFIITYKFEVFISCDGDYAIESLQQKNNLDKRTFDIIQKNIIYLN